MLKKIITKEQREYALNLINQKSIANRGVFDGEYYQQLFGIQAQVIMCDLLGYERPKNNGFDGGFDLIWNNKKYDVKTEIRNTPYLNRFCHNVYAKQVMYEAEGFIFVSYDKIEGIFTICGHIDKEKFMKKAQYFAGGSQRPRSDGTVLIVREGGMYEIAQKELTLFTFN